MMKLVLYLYKLCLSFLYYTLIEFKFANFLFFQDTEFKVTDVQTMGGYVLHVGVMEGSIKVGDAVQLQVDSVLNTFLLVFQCSYCSRRRVL